MPIAHARPTARRVRGGGRVPLPPRRPKARARWAAAALAVLAGLALLAAAPAEAQGGPAPKNIAATAGDGSVTLTFDLTSGNNGNEDAEVVEYRVKSGGGNYGSATSLRGAIGSKRTGFSEQVTGLINGTTYTFQLATARPGGASPWAPPNGVTATPALFVSNLTETNNGTLNTSSVSGQANAFTTGGSSTDRYILSSVTWDFDSCTSAKKSALQVRILRNSSGNPDTQIGSDLTRSGTTDTYTASGITLSGATTYFLYSNGSGNCTFDLTQSNAQTGTANWTIADDGLYHLSGSWTNLGNGRSYKFSVSAQSAATPTLAASSITQTGATLTISGHTGSWHYKADKTPHNSCSAAQSGTTATLTGLTKNTSYTYKAYSDSTCTTANELASATFTTLGDAVDTIRPRVVSYAPADGANSVARNTDLVLTFSEPVKKGSGNIVLNAATGTDQTIAVTNAAVTVSGRAVTINPGSNLHASRSYSVQIAAGAITDLAGNAYVGITNTTDWNFDTAAGTDTTAPTVSTRSPHGVAGVALNTDLVMTFNEPVKKGAGNISILSTTPGAGKSVTIAVTSDQVSVDGSKVTINPSTNLGTTAASYNVRMGAGTFKDLAGNDHAAITGANWWFTTNTSMAAPGAPTLTATARDSRVRLSWTPATTGPTPTHWQYRYKEQATGACTASGQGDWTTVPGGADRRHWTPNKLTNGTRYCFQVRGVQTAGASTVNGAASAGQAATPVASTKPVVSLSNSDAHTVAGGNSITLTVSLSSALSPAAAVTLPLQASLITLDSNGTPTNAEGDAELDDFTIPASVTIPSGQTSATFAVATVADDDDDDEFLRVIFGGGHLAFPYAQVEPWKSTLADGSVQGTWAGITITEPDAEEDEVAHPGAGAEGGSGPPTGLPAVSGVAQVGATLTADTSGIADPDGLANVSWSYQWIRVAEDGAETEVAGATAAAHALGTSDAGSALKVRVNFADDAGNGHSLTSAATAPVVVATTAPDAVKADSIAVVHEGSSLKVTWTAPEGATHYDVTYQGGGVDARGAWNREGTRLTITCDVREGHDNCVVPERAYTVGIRARNAAGESGWAYSATPARPPAAPAAVDASSIAVTHNGNSLSVSWTAPEGATHYDVTYRGGGVDARGAWNRAGTSLTIVCDSREGYDNCVSAQHGYTVGIRARNAHGASGWAHSATPAVAAPSLSVADATAAEGAGASLDFAVTLVPAAAGTVTVDYATRDGTATAGALDYLSASGTLTFAAGETGKTVAVPVLEDADDDGGETMTLALSNAQGATIADAEATGTITDDGPPDAVDASSIAVAHNGDSLSVSWTAPARATHHDATYQGGGVDARAAWNMAGTSLTVTCDVREGHESCVSAEHAYTVGIRARNAAGESGWTYSWPPATHDAAATAAAWLLPSASGAGRRGAVRVANRSGFAGRVSVVAVDDAGRAFAPQTLALGAGAAAEFDARDLELGSPRLGWPGVGGPGAGDWRLSFTSPLDIEARAWAVSPDGFAAALDATVPGDAGSGASPGSEGVPPSPAPTGASMHGRAPAGPIDQAARVLRVALFHPASELEQRSLLRLVNPGAADAVAAVTGIDDAGRSPGRAVLLALPAGSACTVDAAQLESGAGLACGASQPGLGDGLGSWRLAVSSNAPLVAMNLLAAPDGRLSNLSAIPAADAGGALRVPLFPGASDAAGRQGVVRVVNRSNRPGTVSIAAADAAGARRPPLALRLDARAAATLDASDLELGSRAKGLPAGTGAGSSPWRLVLTSDGIDFAAAAYVRGPYGFLAPAPAPGPSPAQPERPER